MSLVRTLALLIVPIVIVAACKGDDEATSPEDKYVGDLARAICGTLEPCCTANGLTGFDSGRCELGAAAFVKQGVDGAKARGASFDQTAADACIAGTARQARACKPAGDDKEIAAVCARVFIGPKKSGEACSSDPDCAPSAEGRGACVKGANGASVCTISKRGAAVGDACSAPKEGPVPAVLADCAANDLQCGLDGKCGPLTAIGTECPGFTRCVNGGYCDAGGKCAATLAQAAACTKNEECSSGACIRGKCGANALGSVTPCTGQQQ